MGLHFHPLQGPVDFSDLLLTCSADWTVKLWRARSIAKPSTAANTLTPIYSFDEADDYVYDVRWHPTQPALFGSVDGSGKFDLWNLNVDTEVSASQRFFLIFTSRMHLLILVPTGSSRVDGGFREGHKQIYMGWQGWAASRARWKRWEIVYLRYWRYGHPTRVRVDRPATHSDEYTGWFGSRSCSVFRHSCRSSMMHIQDRGLFLFTPWLYPGSFSLSLLELSVPMRISIVSYRGGVFLKKLQLVYTRRFVP